MSRPSEYTLELAEQICEKIATSDKGLRSICKELDISTMTVIRWLQNPAYESFCLQYARARARQADYLAEQILEIADETDKDSYVDDKGNTHMNSEFVARSRLRIDARKWVASKLAPKKYGDKIDLTSGGERIIMPDFSKLSTEEIKELLNEEKKNDDEGSA